MRYSETNKLQLSILMQFEYWLEKSAINYDQSSGINLKPFFNGAINGGDEYIYQLLISIDADFLRLNGGKKAFRKLPELLRRGVIFTDEYKEFIKLLKAEA